VAKDLDTSMAKLAIAWCLKNPNVSTVILGASKVAHLEETLTSLDDIEKLTPAVIERIEGILDNKPEHPPF
jgi:aryl-alcohol dehydrogenase-like predicted oxidoreductase